MGKIFEDLSFKANYYENGIALGGTLYIYDEVIVFRPHFFNIGDLSDKVMQICNISGYKKGFLTNLHIYFNDGMDVKLGVWKKDTIINALEMRKQTISRAKAE